jgi:hypothetical protein
MWREVPANQPATYRNPPRTPKRLNNRANAAHHGQQKSQKPAQM